MQIPVQIILHCLFLLFLPHSQLPNYGIVHFNRMDPVKLASFPPSLSLLHTHICCKHIWVTSNVLAQPLAKHLRTINPTHVRADLTHPQYTNPLPLASPLPWTAKPRKHSTKYLHNKVPVTSFPLAYDRPDWLLTHCAPGVKAQLVPSQQNIIPTDKDRFPNHPMTLPVQPPAL